MTSALIIEPHADSLRPLTGMRMDGTLSCPSPAISHTSADPSLSVCLNLSLSQSASLDHPSSLSLSLS